jgi:hypothetical protein
LSISHAHAGIFACMRISYSHVYLNEKFFTENGDFLIFGAMLHNKKEIRNEYSKTNKKFHPKFHASHAHVKFACIPAYLYANTCKICMYAGIFA